MSAADHLLAHQGIRNTAGRLDVLRIFIDHGHALSQPDLERHLGDRYDRVTIYRTLSLFLEKGILHKVLDDAGAMKYALCPDTCHAHAIAHAHEHVHFKCVRCGNTTCIEEIEVPVVKLPSGYDLQERNLLLSGVCKDCNA
jgi:Fur family ferric uptake transcriptional regulator